MSDWYAPNQQAVRGDESGPAEQGEGGSERIDPEPVQREEAQGYDALTKEDLLGEARSRGLSPANAAMTKAELIAVLEEDDRS
jgi:hypothetical protein